MVKSILKNTGKIFFLLIVVFLSGRLYAADIVTELSDSRIAVGESTELKIKITGKSGGVKPVRFPAIDGLHIDFSGSSRNFQFINGKTWSGTVLSFTITAEKKGEYKIPPFILEADGDKVSSREVSLTVTDSRSSGGSTGRPSRGEVDVTVDTVYVGEPFIMRYYINEGSGSPRISGLSEQPHAKGFIIKGVSENENKSGKLHVGSYCLVPLEKGSHDIGGGSVDAIVEMDRGFFSMDRRIRIPFPFRRVNVLPIPSNGRPESFTGDVGEFKIEADLPTAEYKLFEEIKILVKVTGKGNLLTLSKLKVENEDGIKIFTEEKEQSLAVAGKDITGTKSFLLTIIPQKNGAVNPGRIFISYFNPYKKTYEKTESLPLAFNVNGDLNNGGGNNVSLAQKTPVPGKFNYMIIIIIVSAAAFVVLLFVMWEKKKLSIIKAELKPELPVEKLDIHDGDKSELIKNIEDALKKESSEYFLRYADMGINRIDAEKFEEKELKKYNSYKDKIYYCRYGGGVLTSAEINETGKWIIAALKNQ